MTLHVVGYIESERQEGDLVREAQALAPSHLQAAGQSPHEFCANVGRFIKLLKHFFPFIFLYTWHIVERKSM